MRDVKGMFSVQKMQQVESTFLSSASEVGEGNAFSHVCLSVCVSTRGSHVMITHDALDLTVQAPSQPMPAGHGT